MTQARKKNLIQIKYMKEKRFSFLLETCHQPEMMIMIICTSCTSIYRKEQYEMNIEFFFSLFLWWRLSSITRLHLCASSGWDEMNVCLCAKEKRECNYHIHTNVHLTRHTVSQAKESKSFSLSLFLVSFFFLFLSRIHSIISHAVVVCM